MKLSAAERVRPTLWDGIVAVAVLGLAAGILFLYRPSAGNFLTAHIVLDNVSLGDVALSGLKEPQVLNVEGTRYPLTIEMEPGRVRILESACPSQDCVHIGWVSRAGGQIVCLPNKLVITITGTLPPEVDGVTG